MNISLAPSSVLYTGVVWRSGPFHPPVPRPFAIRRTWRSQIRDLAGSGRILVVDDDVNLLRLLRTILIAEGFEVLTSGDGFSAIDLVAGERPDLIILDLQMPGMDGRTVYRELRMRGLNTPVLIASAFGAQAAQLELGAQASIEKPFDPDRLVEVVNTMLGGPAPV